MTEEIKARIELIKKGKLPVGYARKRELIYPQDWGNPVRLNTVLWESKERNKAGVYSRDDVLSVSGQYGVVNQIGLLGRSYAGVSIANYHVVETGDIVYTKSPLKQNPYGIIKLNKGRSGIVSTLYAVYHCNHIITGTYLDFFFTLNTSLNNYLTPLVKKGAKNDMKVNNGDVLKGLISLPPPQEQQKIVEILSTCDRFLSLQRRKIEDLKTLKRSCLSKMFPKQGRSIPEIRFSGFADTWKQCKFEDIALRTSEMGCDAELPRVEYEDIISGMGQLNKDIFLKESNKQGIKFFEGDILYGKLRPYLRNWILPTFSGLAVGDFWVLRPQNVDIQFLFRLIQCALFEDVASQTTGTKMPRADWKLVSKTEFSVPVSTDEQRQIGGFFRSLDNLITLHQRELEEWEKCKKALMQLLLTGIVRVN